MKKIATSVLEVVSAGSVTTGFALFYAPAGLVVGGLFGLLFAREVAR